jgi:Zn-dependent peptidase ImmA (M78 family)/transcriptional regulator with XRE-family HTH domain
MSSKAAQGRQLTLAQDPESTPAVLTDYGARLVAARERARLTQDDVAAALGVSRQMVGYWERDARKPRHEQLMGMARVYGVDVDDLVTDKPEPSKSSADVGEMLYRRSSVNDDVAEAGLKNFVTFLDFYSLLAHRLDRDVSGMTRSPFVPGHGFDEFDIDARRKASEVRAYLGLGNGPIADVDSVCTALGVTVVRAHLGRDLASAISGAFYRHPALGFTIVVNLDMTRGRRRFTAVHELAHALLHSGSEGIIVSDTGAKGEQQEKYADVFAGEFLMPEEGIRRALESIGYGPRLSEVEPVIYLHRTFNVSYITALVRLRQAKIITPAVLEKLRRISPMTTAERLGYKTKTTERPLDPGKSVTSRYPLKFRVLLRDGLNDKVVGPTTVRRALALNQVQFEELINVAEVEASSLEEREWDEFNALGALA